MAFITRERAFVRRADNPAQAASEKRKKKGELDA